VSHDHDDFEIEPIPGLPEELPEGEHILWQGAPDWKVMARRAFHLPWLCAYFLILLAVKIGSDLWGGAAVVDALRGAIGLAVLGSIAGGVFTLYAWWIADSTLYTITNKRLVLRFGVALPMTFNLPFARVRSASLKCFPDGFGDIPVTLEDSQKASYIVMWPNVRPWHLKRPQPMLRCISNAQKVAEILASAASAVPAATAVAEDKQKLSMATTAAQSDEESAAIGEPA